MSAMEVDCGLFDSLGEDDRAALAGTSVLRPVAAGQILLQRGDHSKELCVIKSGLLSVRVTDRSGAVHEIARLGPGECFGEMSMLSGQPASATVVALEDSELVVIGRSQFLAFAARKPVVFENVARVLVNRLRATNELLLRPTRAEGMAIVASSGEPRADSFGIELACALARFSAAKVLYVASSGQTPQWAAGSGAIGPSLFDTFHDRTLLGWHERPRDSANGLAGARVTQLTLKGDCRLTEEQLLAVLREFEDRYDYLLLGAEGQDAPVDVLRDWAPTTFLVVPEHAVGHEDSVLNCTGLNITNGRVQLIVLSASPGSTPLGRLEYLQDRTHLEIRAVVPLPCEPCAESPMVLAQPGSAASQAIGRLARDIAAVKVGLALGVGGSKGYAHLGIIRVLQREDVPIDCLAGCSIGAAVAAGCAGGLPLAQIKRHIDTAARKAMRPNLPLFSLFSSAGVVGELKRMAGQTRFEDLSTPLGLVAVDISRRQEVVLRRGVIWRALAASMALPGIYPPVRIGRRMLVDGGILNPVPISAAASLGANVVISAKLTNPPTERRRFAAARILGRPLVFDTITRCLEIMQSKIVEDSAAQADVTIEPRFSEVAGAALHDFHRAEEFMEAGERAAEEALPRLRSVLPWLRDS